MSVRRTFDAVEVNLILNHPEVLPWVTSDNNKLDAGNFIADKTNYALMADGGCFLCNWLGGLVYEVHTNFLPDARGQNAVRAARDGLFYMFITTPCMEVVTRVPVDNVAADIFTRKMGFGLEFMRDAGWKRNGAMVAVKYYALRYHEWMKKSGLEKTGEWLHQQFENRYNASHTHDSDNAHNYYAGAAVEMVAAGNIKKGIGLYNIWARFAGYEIIKLVSEKPLVLELSPDFCVEISGRDFRLLEKEDKPCHSEQSALE